MLETCWRHAGEADGEADGDMMEKLMGEADGRSWWEKLMGEAASYSYSHYSYYSYQVNKINHQNHQNHQNHFIHLKKEPSEITIRFKTLPKVFDMIITKSLHDHHMIAAF
jgi:hypothetical protein